MTQATELAYTTRRAAEFRLIAGLSAAHFVSHYYILVLPPLFAFIRADYGVSYTEIGLALTVFNAVSAVLQTPAGFLVDRVNARLVLVAGLMCGAAGLAVASLVNSYWVLVAMFGLMGIGNTVYHPANYALLSRHVSAERVGQAYSIHTFAGLAGGAGAPASILTMHSYFGWRGAFMGAAMLGLLVAVALLAQRDEAPERPAAKPRDDAPAADTSWRLLLSTPILINFVFFMLLSLTNFGIMNFSVVALGALWGTSPVTANTALSGNLVMGAVGVLIGGFVAARTERHALIAAAGMLVTAGMCLLIASVDLGAVLLVLVMSLSGLMSGGLMPSRDMIVRQVTPPGAHGKVFGFVTNGFNIAGMVSPLICGALMDRGEPRAVFLLLAATSVLAILTVVSVPRRPAT
jgi:MFS transporter, FSR family, fosmidomycin resistance protein